MSALRLLLPVLVLCSLLPAGARILASRPEAPRDCVPEGRGDAPRHWLGCAGDPGPRRDLSGGERILLGRPLDPNAASADELGQLPGLTPRLGAAIVADRAERGRFGSVDEVERVRGIGPRRLERARPHLAVEPLR
jgi:competence protein ComEA